MTPACIIAILATLLMACFWIIYLIRLVLNDEELQERIRRIRRKLEEERRNMEDKMRRRREAQLDLERGVKEKIQSPPPAAGDETQTATEA